MKRRKLSSKFHPSAVEAVLDPISHPVFIAFLHDERRLEPDITMRAFETFASAYKGMLTLLNEHHEGGESDQEIIDHEMDRLPETEEDVHVDIIGLYHHDETMFHQFV